MMKYSPPPSTFRFVAISATASPVGDGDGVTDEHEHHRADHARVTHRVAEPEEKDRAENRTDSRQNTGAVPKPCPRERSGASARQPCDATGVLLRPARARRSLRRLHPIVHEHRAQNRWNGENLQKCEPSQKEQRQGAPTTGANHYHQQNQYWY